MRVRSAVMSLVVLIAMAAGAGLPASAAPSAAAGRALKNEPGEPPAARFIGLQLKSSASIVDVGEAVQFTLTAKAWPARTRASLSFVSPHHGFSGTMQWDGRCGCFRIAVALARRIHPLENARATATVRAGALTGSASTTFQIRGLAANGRDFSPGGTPSLQAWVADPNPVRNEYQHYCAWVKTVDGLGVRGIPVTFVVHFPGRTQKWYVGLTGTTGLLCSHKSIGNAKLGAQVLVDVYGGRLHAQARFTARS